MIRYFIILFSFLYLFSACEKEVEIKVAPISSKLVIISNFNGGDEDHTLGDKGFFSRDSAVMRVTVSRTESALSISGDTLIHVADAVVELYSGTQFLERLTYYPLSQQDPYYEAEDFRLSAGETYNLKVSAPNFTPVTAKAYIPAITSETRTSISTTETTSNNGFKQVKFTLNLEIDDFPILKNYYHLNLYQEVKLLRFNAVGEVVSSSDRGVLVGSSPLPFNLKNNNQEVLPYVDNKGVLIRDDSFDGETGIFTFEGEFPYNPETEELGNFIVELRNTSRDYYLYHSSLARQVRVQSGFDAISGPVVLHNNIENGFGIFAGYTPTFTNIDLSD